jgi:hypothetical protein
VRVGIPKKKKTLPAVGRGKKVTYTRTEGLNFQSTPLPPHIFMVGSVVSYAICKFFLYLSNIICKYLVVADRFFSQGCHLAGS